MVVPYNFEILRRHNYGIRLNLVRSRHFKPTGQYTGKWETEAYSAQIAVDPSLITHAAGFKLQVGDGTEMPVCDEQRVKETATVFDLLVYLLGPCAKAVVDTLGSSMVAIYKTHENSRCCRFDGYITTDHSVHVKMNFHYRVTLITEWTKLLSTMAMSLWNVSGSDSVIKFQVVCKTRCSAVLLLMEWDRNFQVCIVYHANLVDKTDFTGITFPQPQIDVANSRPRLTTWKHVCHNYHCYSTPISYMTVTWDEAQETCEEQKASLVSINSDLEWKLLTMHFFQLPEGNYVHRLPFTLLYIGLVTDVSTKYRTFDLRAYYYLIFKIHNI